jgi:hypothetical protein
MGFTKGIKTLPQASSGIVAVKAVKGAVIRMAVPLSDSLAEKNLTVLSSLQRTRPIQVLLNDQRSESFPIPVSQDGNVENFFYGRRKETTWDTAKPWQAVSSWPIYNF